MKQLPPRAGDLTHRIKIRLHTDVPNSSMGLDPQYTAGIDRWARVEQISAATYFASRQTGEDVTHWITLRRGTLTRPEDMTTDLVIEHKGRRCRVVRARVHPLHEQYTAVEALDLGAIA
jgi:head-tail adaptor